jgi:hypothetical protein
MSSPALADRHQRDWRTWLYWCGGSFAAMSLGLYAGVVLVDPFATGRFALTQRVDVTTKISRLAKAGLVRDPQFDAAIIGNSATFSIDPARVGAVTGRKVVQLAISASVPAEQLVIASLFERFHPGTATLTIFMLDSLWCREGSPAQNPFVSFPYWLYEGSSPEYLSRIFFQPGLEAAVRRVGIWLGVAQSTERYDGFSPSAPPGDRNKAAAALLALQRPFGGPPADAPFPAIDALGGHLATLSPASTVALVFIPVFITQLPVAGSPAAARLEACKDRVGALAKQRPRTAYVDMRIDAPLSRDVEAFDDSVHFRANVAEQVVTEVARGLNDLKPPR